MHVAEIASDSSVELFADAHPIILTIEGQSFFDSILLGFFFVDCSLNFLAAEPV